MDQDHHEALREEENFWYMEAHRLLLELKKNPVVDFYAVVFADGALITSDPDQMLS